MRHKDGIQRQTGQKHKMPSVQHRLQRHKNESKQMLIIG